MGLCLSSSKWTPTPAVQRAGIKTSPEHADISSMTWKEKLSDCRGTMSFILCRASVTTAGGGRVSTKHPWYFLLLLSAIIPRSHHAQQRRQNTADHDETHFCMHGYTEAGPLSTASRFKKRESRVWLGLLGHDSFLRQTWLRIEWVHVKDYCFGVLKDASMQLGQL